MRIKFKKEWVTPVAVGVISFGAGIIVGETFVGRKVDKAIKDAMHKVDRRLGIVHERLNNIETKTNQNQMEFDFEKEDREKTFKTERLERDKSFNNMLINMNRTANWLSVEEEEALEKAKQDAEQEEESKMNAINVFRAREVDDDEDDDEWDYEVEVAQREANPNKPYVIHRDEFFNKEAEDYNQSTLTFYAGDGVLVDELDVPIYNFEKITGDLLFGHGSGDPYVVYARNDHLEAEYEVSLDEGFFSVEVLGTDTEEQLNANNMKHSAPKFRD